MTRPQEALASELDPFDEDDEEPEDDGAVEEELEEPDESVEVDVEDSELDEPEVLDELAAVLEALEPLRLSVL